MVTDVSSTKCQLTILVPLLSSCNTNFTILHHLWGEVREGQVREGSQGYQHVWKVVKNTALHKKVKYCIVLYSRKLLREKTFMDFAVLWLFAKFGGVVSMAQASNPWKFLHENRIFTNSQKFSLSKFSCFAVVTDVNCDIRILHYLQTKSISIQTCFNWNQSVHAVWTTQYMAYLIAIIADADHTHPLCRKGSSYHLQ